MQPIVQLDRRLLNGGILAAPSEVVSCGLNISNLYYVGRLLMEECDRKLGLDTFVATHVCHQTAHFCQRINMLSIAAQRA